MARIARRWKALGAALAAAMAVGTAGFAGVRIDGVRIDYAPYAKDERLTLSGSLVRPALEVIQEQRVRSEMARVLKTQTYQPAPAIWRIADADTTIYIFGTVHTLPPGFRWRNPGLESVIVRADTLILESTDDASDAVTFLEGIPEDQARALPPLIDRVSHRTRARLAELQAQLPANANAELDRMPSWLAAITIGQVRDILAGDIPAQGADEWLRQHFRATGRPVLGIEDSRSVVTNINAVPERAQRLMLEGALFAPTRSHDELDAAAHAWAQGQVGPGSPLMIMPAMLDPSTAMADPLLNRRNSDWVEKLQARLKQQQGTILFAAGAGHFVGPGSVIELLQRRGMRVERVQ